MARHLAFHDLVDQVLETCTVGAKNTSAPRFKIDNLLNENTAAGKSAASELGRVIGVGGQFDIRLFDVNRSSKVSWCYSIEHMFSLGTVFAPDKSLADDVITISLVSPVGKRDMVDSGTMALRWLRDNSYAITQVEEHVDEQERGRFRSRLKPLHPA
jgi:hypothetical protein